MKKTTFHIISLLIICSTNTYSQSSTGSSSIDPSKSPQACTHWLSLFKPFCRRLHQTWTEGKKELYFSGYAWHNRFTYSPKQMRKKKYNELAWGGGIGKGFFDEKGNWHGIYSFAFLDSHRNVEPIIGYAYLKVLHCSKHLKPGLGFSILMTARPDILHYVPFPGAVPWAGLFYKRLSLKAAYIPGAKTNGNVLYVVGTYTFDKLT